MLRYILWRIAVDDPDAARSSRRWSSPSSSCRPATIFESYIAELQAQGEASTCQEIEFLRKEYGFDKPPVVRYFYWVGGMLHGDFGYSFEYQLPVTRRRRRPAVADHAGLLHRRSSSPG